MKAWYLTYWPWITVLVFLIAYEIFALINQERTKTRKHRTLTQMVQLATRRVPVLIPITLTIVSILLVHFWLTGPVAYWLGAIMVVSIWLVYVRLRAPD